MIHATYGTKHTLFAIPEHGGITHGMKRLVRIHGVLVIQTNYNSKGWKDIYHPSDVMDGLLDLFHDDAHLALAHVIDNETHMH